MKTKSTVAIDFISAFQASASFKCVDVTIKMYAMYKHNLIKETYSQDLKMFIFVSIKLYVPNLTELTVPPVV